MSEHNVDTTEEITSEDTETTQSHVPVARQLAILAAILLLIFGSGYIPKVLQSLDGEEEIPKTEATAVASTDASESISDQNYFENVSIRASSAYVWDVQKQKALYQKNADEQVPLASITKIMTALVAHELLGTDTSVPITLSAIQQDGSSGLIDGESFALETLRDLTLLSSSNDGAFAMATAAGAYLLPNGGAHTFVDAMNIRAEELGLTQTYFRNPTGLDISEEEGGAYGSARDVTFLMEYILTHYPEIIEATQDNDVQFFSESGQAYRYENTNPTTDQIDGLIGSKTGYTELAGGNLVVAFNAALNRPVVIVVLGSSRSGRFQDVLTLADSARKTVTQ